MYMDVGGKHEARRGEARRATCQAHMYMYMYTCVCTHVDDITDQGYTRMIG